MQHRHRPHLPIASLLTLCLLTGCASAGSGLHLVTPSFQTLAAQTAGPVRERFEQCRTAWNHYETRCRRDLIMWHNSDQRGFCTAWSKSGFNESVLPGFTRDTKRCY